MNGRIFRSWYRLLIILLGENFREILTVLEKLWVAMGNTYEPGVN